MSIFDSIRTALNDIQNFFSENPVDSTTQVCSSQKPEKIVSQKAIDRLKMAQEAIDYAKKKLSYGAGNQKKALENTDFNSYYRMKVVRDNKLFDIPPEVLVIAKENFQAFKAAKAELAKGGNCGEHADVVYDYLRQKYPNEYIQYSQKNGLDHAFVIIGDPSKESDNELVVADAWPTAPTPVLWEDHFAYISDKKKLLNHANSQGDDRDYKQEILDAGLSLNSEGVTKLAKLESKEDTQKKIKKGTNDWVWDHSDTVKNNCNHDYTTTPSTTTP